MQNRVLEATNVFHSYGKAPAKREVLKDFSFSLRQGEFASLMGPSGSGKSTFLHLAAGLLKVDRGEIKIGSTLVSSLGDTQATIFRRRNIGIVFQSFNLIETLDVFDNIALGARLDGKKADSARVEELLDEMNLAGSASRHIGELSGGERQRVAIARALYLKPKLILADEPTGNLDMKAAQQIREVFSFVNKKENCSILLVTHDPLMAAASSRVCFLKDGAIARTLQDGFGAEDVSRVYLETAR